MHKHVTHTPQGDISSVEALREGATASTTLVSSGAREGKQGAMCGPCASCCEVLCALAVSHSFACHSSCSRRHTHHIHPAAAHPRARSAAFWICHTSPLTLFPNTQSHTHTQSLPVYLDSEGLASYHGRLQREDGARAARLRWCVRACVPRLHLDAQTRPLTRATGPSCCLL